MWWSSFLEHCPKWGNDDGDYDSPTSPHETPDEKNKKKRKKYEEDKVFIVNSKYGLNETIIREKIGLKYPNKKNNDM